MKLQWMVPALLAMGLCTTSVQSAEGGKPIRLILVGDSTVAPKNGYGDALCARLRADVGCVNLAMNGRSSGSFRAEGRWDKVQELLKDGGAWSQTYVLVQFGHNDQPGKPGRSTDLVTEFPVNMARYAQEVKALGGVPVLVTPLTRRTFKDNVLQGDLRAWAEATLNTAAAHGTTALDLNAESAVAVQAMGQAEADTLAVVPPPDKAAAAAVTLAGTFATEKVSNSSNTFDRTHVGEKGARLFSGMVARELKLAIPATTPYFKDEN
jgi:lysophospholipase L1-like esterase